MKYIYVKWKHNNTNDPTDIYTELDDQQWEYRKVEILKNGSCGFADKTREVGGSRLGIEPWPDLAMLGKEPEFSITEISKKEFEDQWLKANSNQEKELE